MGGEGAARLATFGTNIDQSWTRCHPEACIKAQREQVSKSEATSPHKHRRSVNAEKRKPKRKTHASKRGNASEPHKWGNKTMHTQGNEAMGTQKKRTFKQNNQWRRMRKSQNVKKTKAKDTCGEHEQKKSTPTDKQRIPCKTLTHFAARLG